MVELRLVHQLPEATKEWGWEYHHLGIPTAIVFPDEFYLPRYKFFVSGLSTSPFGIEWMRFERDSPIHKLIQTMPHLAFVVKYLDFELSPKDFNVLSYPDKPSDGIRVAIIEFNRAPFELMEFSF